MRNEGRLFADVCNIKPCQSVLNMQHKCKTDTQRNMDYGRTTKIRYSRVTMARMASGVTILGLGGGCGSVADEHVHDDDDDVGDEDEDIEDILIILVIINESVAPDEYRFN